MDFRRRPASRTDRLRNTAKEPHNWLTYGGDYFSQRYSLLTQITPANVKSLALSWVYQSPQTGSWQATPIVVDGIMYLTQRPNDVVALDAASGRVFWVYRYQNDPELVVCCGSNNRGVAILGETLFMGTLDANLIALDATKRPADLENEGRRQQSRLLGHRVAARRERQGHRRRGRRRIRHPRLHRRVRRADRERGLALLHGSGAWRGGT